MQLEVVVPGWLAPRPDLDELLRHQAPAGRDAAVDALPPTWDWEHARHTPRMLYSLEQADETRLLDTVLATGRRERAGREEFCRLDSLCTVVLRVRAGRPDAVSYPELAAFGDDVAESLTADFRELCEAAEEVLSGRLRPAAPGALPGGRPLWSHRVIVLEPGDADPVGGAPVRVRNGLTIDNGQTCIDPATNDVDAVVRALELATVHWLVVDDLNRELFARVRDLHDEVIATEPESLEAAYYNSMAVSGMVSAVEMLLDDQRLALPPAEREVYDAYMRQWSLGDLREQIRVRAQDVVDHSGRRLEFVRTRLAARTNVVLLLLSFATLVPGTLVVVQFLADNRSGIAPASVGHVLLFLVAFAATILTVLTVLAVHRRAARRLPGE